MELELATAATSVVLGFFRRLLSGKSDRLADGTAQRVMAVLENLGRGDPATRSAMTTLRDTPDEPVARALLERRIETFARQDPIFRQDLSRSIGMDQRNAGDAVAIGNVSLSNSNNNRISWRNITKNSGAMWLLVGAGSVLLVIALLCGGTAIAFARNHTSLFDTETDLSSAGGWSYRVSEAHLRTSPQLEGRGPAKPGYRYLYFDITVENRLQDREAPGIQFNFARAENTMSADCGAQQTGFLGPISSYAAGIVPGWCLSKNSNLLASGSSCFETNDTLFHTVDRIPPGGKNQVRCVDSYLVKDDFPLNSIRVYYLGASIAIEGAELPYLKQIPIAT